MKTNYIAYSIITVLLFIIGIFIGIQVGGNNYANHTMPMAGDSAFAEHCKMMPNMAGCERYISNDILEMDHSMMDPMQMSMADMGAMLEGKTGDDLDKAFLEGMIPHHQGAIDMAQYLVDAKHSELQKMGEEIISAQQAEIDQMNAWLVEWGYKN